MTPWARWCWIPTSRSKRRCHSSSRRSGAPDRRRRPCAAFASEALLFPAPGPVRSPQGRGLLGRTAALSGPQRVEESSLCRGLRLWTHRRPRRRSKAPSLATALPREQWHTLILDAHPGYITWADYEENLARLRSNSAAYGADRRHGPPREGPALLQGLAVCGRCGGRMTVRYYTRHGQISARVLLSGRGHQTGRVALPEESWAPRSTGPSASCWSRS